MSRMSHAQRRAREEPKKKQKRMKRASRKMDALARQLGAMGSRGNNPEISGTLILSGSRGFCPPCTVKG
jgi:cell division septation protein DedD